MRIVSILDHKERVEFHSSLPFQRLSPLDLAVWEMGDFTSDSTFKFFLKKPGGFMRGEDCHGATTNQDNNLMLKQLDNGRTYFRSDKKEEECFIWVMENEVLHTAEWLLSQASIAVSDQPDGSYHNHQGCHHQSGIYAFLVSLEKTAQRPQNRFRMKVWGKFMKISIHVPP